MNRLGREDIGCWWFWQARYAWLWLVPASLVILTSSLAAYSILRFYLSLSKVAALQLWSFAACSCCGSMLPAETRNPWYTSRHPVENEPPQSHCRQNLTDNLRPRVDLEGDGLYGCWGFNGCQILEAAVSNEPSALQSASAGSIKYHRPRFLDAQLMLDFDLSWPRWDIKVRASSKSSLSMTLFSQTLNASFQHNRPKLGSFLLSGPIWSNSPLWDQWNVYRLV